MRTILFSKLLLELLSFLFAEKTSHCFQFANLVFQFLNLELLANIGLSHSNTTHEKGIKSLQTPYQRDLLQTFVSIPKWTRYVWKLRLTWLENVLKHPGIGQMNCCCVVGSETGGIAISLQHQTRERVIRMVLGKMGFGSFDWRIQFTVLLFVI